MTHCVYLAFYIRKIFRQIKNFDWKSVVYLLKQRAANSSSIQRFYTRIYGRTCHSSLCFQFDLTRSSQGWMATLVPSFLRSRGLSALWLLQLLLQVPIALATYSIGAGRADCTGPTADIVFVSITLYAFLNGNWRETSHKIFSKNETKKF